MVLVPVYKTNSILNPDTTVINLKKIRKSNFNFNFNIRV